MFCDKLVFPGLRECFANMYVLYILCNPLTIFWITLIPSEKFYRIENCPRWQNALCGQGINQKTSITCFAEIHHGLITAWNV